MKVSCYGIIPFRKTAGRWEILVVNNATGFWGFPKGHADAGEDARTAALRELFEETGLKVRRFLSDIPLSEHYRFVRDEIEFDKTVIYFLAEVEGTLKLQKSEITDAKWVSLSEAQNHLTYPSTKEIGRALKFMSI